MDQVAAERMHDAFELHYSGLVRLGFLLTGSQETAEDLVQESFVRSRFALPTLAPEKIRSYLRQVVVNQWRNRKRRLALERRPHVDAVDPPLPLEERDVLWHAVKRLPPRQRACLVLRYYEDLSEPQVADVLRCSVGTVKSQTRRAIGRLRRELAVDD